MSDPVSIICETLSEILPEDSAKIWAIQTAAALKAAGFAVSESDAVHFARQAGLLSGTIAVAIDDLNNFASTPGIPVSLRSAMQASADRLQRVLAETEYFKGTTDY